MTYYTFLKDFLGDTGDLTLESGHSVFTVATGGVGGKWTLVKIHEDFVILNSTHSECIPLSQFIIKYRKK